MLKIGIVGCGLQAATIASYLNVFGDEYEVAAVMDMNEPAARQRLAEKRVILGPDCRFYPDIEVSSPKRSAPCAGRSGTSATRITS